MSPVRDLESLLTLTLAAHTAARRGRDYLPVLLDAQILLDDLVTPGRPARVRWRQPERKMLPPEVVAANLDAARAHLAARGGPDPEGAGRLRELYTDVRPGWRYAA